MLLIEGNKMEPIITSGVKDIDSNDAIDLWKYFNDRMLHLKDVLLNVLT